MAVHQGFQRREVVASRDGCACHYCGDELDLVLATLDHVWPRCLGGTLRYTNIVLACVFCNWSRGAAIVKCSCRFCARARVAGLRAYVDRVLALEVGRGRAGVGAPGRRLAGLATITPAPSSR